MKKLSLAVLAVVCAFIACGPPKKGEFNPNVAKSSATANLVAAVTLVNNTDLTTTDGGDVGLDDGKGLLAADAFATAAFASHGVITPVEAEARRVKQLIGAFAEGECVCVEADHSCTFSNCERNALTYSGTLSWSGGVVNADLTYVYRYSNSVTVTMTYLANLTITDNSINGTIETTGNSTAIVSNVEAPGPYNFWSKLTFTDISYSGTEINSGSVRVEAKATIALQEYNADETINY